MHKFYMHLTNYSLNKNSKEYKTSDDYLKENEASKRTLTSMYSSLEKMGIKREELEKKIEDVSLKVLVALEPYIAHQFNLALGKEASSESSRVFHIFGFDVMFDTNLKPWILEMNANPSLNINLEIDKPNGEYFKMLSEIDKYVKNCVVDGAIKLIKKRKKFSEITEFQDYVKVLPLSEGHEYKQFEIFKRACKIFERLTGVRETPYLSQSKFSRIGRLPGMTTDRLKMPDYDILFTSVNGGCKMMYMETFFDSLIQLGSRLYPTIGDEYTKLQNLIEHLYPKIIIPKK